jgi:PAS domain S-box-containing protein
MLGLDWDRIDHNVRTVEDRLHPEDVKKVRAVMDRHLNGQEELFECEYRLRHEDGGWVRVLDRGAVVEKDGNGGPLRAVGIHADIGIAERSQSGKGCGAGCQTKALQALAEIVPEILWMADSNGKIIYANSRWYALIGAEESNSPFDTLIQSAHPEDLPKIEAHWKEAVSNGESCECVLRLRMAFGSYRSFQVRALPSLTEGGEITGWLGIAAEMTQAVDQGVSKADLLAVLSHELRSPLNAMYGWAQMLLTSDHDPKRVRHAAEVIASSAELQKRLIDDLSAFSQMSTGTLRSEFTKFSLRDLVARAVESIEPLVGARSIKLTVENPGKKSLMVSGDQKRIEQAVGNVLSNALKFTQEGGHIAVRLSSRKGHALVTVADDGLGIEPRMIPKVFDMFKNAGDDRHRKLGGLGLGLTLVKKFVEMHGGTVTAHSDGEGKGAKFTITIPLA